MDRKDIVYIARSYGVNGMKEECTTSKYDTFKDFISNSNDHIGIKIYIDGNFYKSITHKAEISSEDILILVNNWLKY